MTQGKGQGIFFAIRLWLIVPRGLWYTLRTEKNEVSCMNIVMLEPLDVPRAYLDDLLAPLIKQGHQVVVCHEALTDAQKQERVADAQALIIANGKLGEELLSHARQLQYISVAFTGTDHLDKKACERRGIKVSNASGYSTLDVAELTIALTISLLRSILPADARVRAQQIKAGLPANRLHGKTVGIIGTGAIGLRAAELFRAFGCELLATSRTEHSQAKALGMKYVPLDVLLRESDIVSLHTPLTEETRHLIGEDQLAMMKKTAVLINCARGAVVDTAALAKALNAGDIAGAAFDVFENEPPIAADHPLLHARNALLTPHIAFYTKESMKDRAVVAIDNVTQWLDGKHVRPVAL